MTSVRHHLISRSLQRHWSLDGRSILHIDKDRRTVRLAGTSDLFVERRLLTYASGAGPSDAVEVDFGRIEGLAMPHVERFVAGDDDDSAQMGVRAIMALHWARGLATVAAMRRIMETVSMEQALGAEADQRLRRMFAKEYGRQPTQGELADLYLERAEELRTDNTFFVQRVQEHYMRALEDWAGKHIQRVRAIAPHRATFVFADAPVVITSSWRGSASAPVALGDADSVWMPLAPHLAVFLTARPEAHERVAPDVVQYLNLRMWHWASRFLGAVPSDDVDRDFGWEPGTLNWIGPRRLNTYASNPQGNGGR